MQHLATQNFAFSTEITQIFRARKAKNSRIWCKIFARFSSVRYTKLLMSTKIIAGGGAAFSLESAQRLATQKIRVQRRLRRDRANFPRKSSRTCCKFSAFAMRNTPPIQPASLQKKQIEMQAPLAAESEVRSVTKICAFGGALAQNLRNQNSNLLQNFCNFGSWRAKDAIAFPERMRCKTPDVCTAFT